MIEASFGLSETGAVRQDNQDSYLLDAANGIFAVADGLGGLPNGARASKVALNVLHEKLLKDSHSSLQEIVTDVNAEARDIGFELDSTGFGTTLTLARFIPERSVIQIAHVGDSAAFLVKNDTVDLLTKEHTVAARMVEENWVDACEAIPLSAHHTLTQCIGQDLYIDPQVSEFPIQKGYRIFLLTDGVTKSVPDSILRSIISSRDSINRIGQMLSFRIEAAGSPDNYTIVAVEF